MQVRNSDHFLVFQSLSILPYTIINNLRRGLPEPEQVRRIPGTAELRHPVRRARKTARPRALSKAGVGDRLLGTLNRTFRFAFAFVCGRRLDVKLTSDDGTGHDVARTRGTDGCREDGAPVFAVFWVEQNNDATSNGRGRTDFCVLTSPLACRGMGSATVCGPCQLCVRRGTTHEPGRPSLLCSKSEKAALSE